MGKVVPVTFWGRVPSTGLLPKADIPQADMGDLLGEDEQLAKMLFGDAVYLRASTENVGYLRQACKRGDEATEYIFSIAGFQKKDEHVDLRQSSLKGQSLEVLCGYLVDSHQLQWNKQPHYFGAIILEINGRLSVIQEACPDMELPGFKG
jgi:hypothetical protein